jgi:tRNA-2-methylthio-N6-dimethylallyladenosine synthase
LDYAYISSRLELLLTVTVSPNANARKVFVKSFGCQMNVVDSQRMSDIAEAEGYESAESVEDADLVILNTCHIREKASEKIFSELGKLRELKDERRALGRETTLVVAGCVAQAEGATILKRQKAVDLVVGPQSYHRLPELLAKARTRPQVDIDFPAEDKFDFLPPPRAATTRARGPAAFVTAQEGCDKFCSFCVVPYTRGAEVSRPPASVLHDVATLVRDGVIEVTLVGQNINAYRGVDASGAPTSLAGLLAEAGKFDEIRRLRYATSHPIDMRPDLIAAHRDNPKLAPFLHLPVQAGSDRILKRMNRRHTAADYLDIIADARQARSDLAVSSDFIVGFPEETDTDFEQTLALVEKVGFASAYAFKYSERPGTPAADRAGQVDEAVKTQRLATLQRALDRQRFAFNERCVGMTFEVLLERKGRRLGQFIGRSPYMQSVLVDDPAAEQGTSVNVNISRAGPNSLEGIIRA